jgi:hypothetical protein
MPFAELDRVAVVVDELDVVAASLEAVLGVALSTRDVPELGLRAAIGNSGVELVQQTAEVSRAAQYWHGPLAAVCIRVEDVEEAARRMEAAGFEVVQTAVTAGGMREYFYGNNFHGIPIVLHESSGDLLHDVGDDQVALEVEWKD